MASKATGAKAGWVIRKHLMPNCISVIIISTALQIPSAIFTESYLSFLGLGVNAPMPSLGSLANAAREGLQSYPYKLVFPAIVICLIGLFALSEILSRAKKSAARIRRSSLLWRNSAGRFLGEFRFVSFVSVIRSPFRDTKRHRRPLGGQRYLPSIYFVFFQVNTFWAFSSPDN